MILHMFFTLHMYVFVNIISVEHKWHNKRGIFLHFHTELYRSCPGCGLGVKPVFNPVFSWHCYIGQEVKNT